MSAAQRVYLDWNAGAPVAAAAREAAVAALTAGGNASSIHAEGRANRSRIEKVRRALALRFGVADEQVVFTSGGTEANVMALAPGASADGPPVERLVTSAVEHAAVRAGGRFPAGAVTVVPVDQHGVVDLAALERTLAEGPPALVSVMAANNETGVLQPLSAIADLAGRFGALFHTDAVQAFGREPEGALCADLVSVSGHKIGAPQGVGALVARRPVTLPPLIRGGGQERGSRGGTENAAAVAGFGAALALPAADPQAWDATRAARDAFEAELTARFGATVHGAGAPRLPNTSLFSVGETPAELNVIGLDLAGMAVSSGAACSSGRVTPSHVLAAMGVTPALAATAIRVSVGPSGAEDALRRFLVALQKVIVPMTH